MSRSGINRHRFLNKRGTTTLEMALIVNVLLMLLVGSLELGRYFFVAESLNYFVGELAHAAIKNPDADWSTEKRVLIARAPILRPEDFLTLNVDVARAAAPALTTVTIATKYRYTFVLPILSRRLSSIDAGLTLSFVAPAR